MSCPDCFNGAIHSGTPRGQVTKLHGLDTYVTNPTNDDPVKGIIVVIPDAFGWEFVNIRLLADNYAEKGQYTVYVPEFMDGHAAPVWAIDLPRYVFRTGNLYDWIVKPYYVMKMLYGLGPFAFYNTVGRSWPRVESFFAGVRSDEGSKLPIGAVGFCWGGKHTMLLAHGYTTADGKQPLIDAGFTAHPSMLAIPGDIEKVTKPVSVAIGDNDFNVKMPDVEKMRNILESKAGAACGEVKIFHGAGHGFAVRADHVLEDSARQATEAEEQALDWFRRQFSTVSY
ncbi:hypothetical protein FQN54_000925 [Arachnomyces sp. PD_36]|nr:hypothetical protein FQN54_000925 [Arachnomyces sp. PD_36]